MFNNQITKAYFDAGAQRNIMHRKCECGSSLKEFPSIKKKRRTNEEFFCGICNCFISIGHKGKNDILQHLNTLKHQKNLRSQSGSSGLQNLEV
jgi:hypothetical protein